MKNPQASFEMKRPTAHGRGVRGLGLSRSSLLFEGAFGRIFRALPPAEFGASDAETLNNLKTLATKIVGTDGPKDGPDTEESGIPALYTYLGQFIDHDLTFDPASSLQQQNDPDGLVDYRTPKFDLDSVYGRGPDDQPYLYDVNPDRGQKFLLGKPLTGGGPLNLKAQDLARNAAQGQSARAIIGDPRNDENALVSQLQGLFLRFHNRLIDDKRLSFADAQRTLRYHYQWMLINDFLPKVVNAATLHSIFPHLANKTSISQDPPKLRFYRARDAAFMPFEFSVAAYRFGHSMVRPGYRLNDGNEGSDPLADTLLPIFGQKGPPERPHSLRGFMAPADNWALDWGRFIDIDSRPNGVLLENGQTVEKKDPTPQQLAENRGRLQLAYRIDTSIVLPLGDLPPDVADKIIPSLAERNLVRGWRLRLPSGQAVAKAMGERILDPVLIGKFEDNPDPEPVPIETVNSAFKDNAPLWVYCLAETANCSVPGLFGVKSNLLGPVGGRIVAETFAGLLVYDSQSFINQDPNWKPSIGGGTFGLKEFVNFALGK